MVFSSAASTRAWLAGGGSAAPSPEETNNTENIATNPVIPNPRVSMGQILSVEYAPSAS
jgi:hypothetical protein